MAMSRRIDIELTSARPDGTWTWRAAGAKEPRGVLDGALLPAGAATGTVLKADAETGMEGTTILSVISNKEKAAKANLLEILPSDRPFEEVTQQLTGRSSRDSGDRRERRDRPPRRNDGGDGPGRGPRPSGPGGPRSDGDRRPAGRTDDRNARSDRGPRPGGGQDRPPRRSGGPRFTAPPEMPQRPKAKRLKPGRAHRNAVLAELPEEQRAVAERALQGGLPAVRQAVNEQNARLKSEGKPEIPAAGLLNLAEQMLPKLRVAEWLDRADAALHDLEELDLRDLRSVVAAGEDPAVARDEATRDISAKLKEGLVAKQDKEMALWLADIEAAITIGRIVRALKLSSQPPKAGIRFPAELAGKLAGAATASLSHDALPDRWIAVLEAAAFSPIRSHVQPTDKPTQVNDELLATVKRLGTLLPHVSALFGVEVDPKAHAPKPLRPTRPAAAAKKPVRQIPPPPAAPEVGQTAEDSTPTSEPTPVEPTDAEPAAAEPTADVEPTAEAEPTADVEPTAEAEPTAEVEVQVEPAADVEPAAEVEAEPAADAEPAAEIEPAGVVADEPVESQPSEVEEPSAATDEPVELAAVAGGDAPAADDA